MADQEALLRMLREFARTMAGSYDISDVLHDLSDRVVDILGATAAGVSLCGDDGVLRFVTATDQAAMAAEEAQELLQSGPCYRSLEERHPVPVSDVRQRHAEWPEFCPVAERHGLLAVLGIPLMLDDRRVGSLNVYDSAPREWTKETVSVATVLADIGAAYILNASELARSVRTAEQLQTALDSRIVIEQAKGKLSAQLDVDTDTAFHALRQYARSHQRTVREVASAVVERGAIAIER